MSAIMPAHSVWLRVLHRAPRPRARIIALPYAGGTAGSFRRWDRWFPPDVELCAVQLPGREDRHDEPLLRRIADVIGPLSDALHAAPALPFVLVGHSLGAMLAHELTLALVRLGRPLPLHLAVSGARAPHLEPIRAAIYTRSDADFLEAVRALNGMPAEVLANRELVEWMLPILRADFELAETRPLRAPAPLPVPITVWGGDADPLVPVDAVREWHAHTRASCAGHVFPGDHFFLHSHGADLCARLLAMV